MIASARTLRITRTKGCKEVIKRLLEHVKTTANKTARSVDHEREMFKYLFQD